MKSSDKFYLVVLEMFDSVFQADEDWREGV